MSDKAKNRVIKEIADLEDKISKLSEFMDNPKYDRLSMAAQRLLQEQYAIMQQYLTVLKCRISIWEEDYDNRF